MKEIHYIGIMLCIIVTFLVAAFHISVENRQLEKYNNCMKNKWSTDSNSCKFCDSISRNN